MLSKVLPFVLVGSIVFSGCGMQKKDTLPQTFSNVSVRTSAAPGAELPAKSKYAFVKFAADTEQNAEVVKIEQRIEKALADELGKKGYKPGKYSDVNFFVVYNVGLSQQIDLLVAKSKVQGNEWISALVIPADYVSGALLVQIIDAKTMEPVWLGAFNADIALASVSEQAKKERVAYAVRELLKNFPK